MATLKVDENGHEIVCLWPDEYDDLKTNLSKIRMLLTNHRLRMEKLDGPDIGVELNSLRSFHNAVEKLVRS